MRLAAAALVALLATSAAAAASSCDEIANMIKSGQYQPATQLLVSALTSASTPSTTTTLPPAACLTQLESQLGESKQRLGELTSKVALAKSTALARPHIEPALQWAQSPDSLFINVKFAHKIDAPACIDLVDAKHEFFSNRVVVTAACSKTQAGKHFKLDLLLFSEIDPAQSNWTLTSVGRGSFQLKKLVPQTKWDRLLSAREKPKNVHLWWAMQEKFEDAMSDLETAVKKTAAEDTTKKNDTAAGDTVEEKEEEEEEEAAAVEDSIVDKKKALLKEAASKVKQQVDLAKAERKAELKKELEAIAAEEAKRKSQVEEELKRQLAAQQSDEEEPTVDEYVKLFHAQLLAADDKEERVEL